MSHVFVALLVMSGPANTPPNTPDDWVGQEVFPRYDGVPIRDATNHRETERLCGPARVIAKNADRVNLRHRGVQGLRGDYVLAADLIKVEDAPPYFTERLRKYPKDRWSLVQRATAWSFLRKPEEGIKDCNEALKIAEDDLAYSVRAYCLFQKEQFKEAIADYTRALQLKPDDPSVHYNRATAWLRTGRLDEAIDDYSEVIRIEPNHPETFNAYLYRGKALFEKKDNEHSIKDFSKALAMQPQSDAALQSRGSAYFNKKDYEKAILDYRAAIEIDSADPYPFLCLAGCYALTGRKPEALDHLRKCLELGWSDLKYAEGFRGFESIRPDPQFKALFDKYRK
jgi:tetratricopeptide (TPR) repeat protein